MLCPESVAVSRKCCWACVAGLSSSFIRGQFLVYMAGNQHLTYTALLARAHVRTPYSSHKNMPKVISQVCGRSVGGFWTDVSLPCSPCIQDLPQLALPTVVRYGCTSNDDLQVRWARLSHLAENRRKDTGSEDCRLELALQ